MATKAETSKVLKEGDKAPAFRVTADDGEKVSLGEYRGKHVILFFYPKAKYSRLNGKRQKIKFESRDAMKKFEAKYGDPGAAGFCGSADEIKNEAQIEFAFCWRGTEFEVIEWFGARKGWRASWGTRFRDRADEH